MQWPGAQNHGHLGSTMTQNGDYYPKWAIKWLVNFKIYTFIPKMMVQNLNSFYGSFLSRMLEFEWKPKDRCVPSGLAAIGSATSEVNGR